MVDNDLILMVVRGLLKKTNKTLALQQLFGILKSIQN